MGTEAILKSVMVQLEETDKIVYTHKKPLPPGQSPCPYEATTCNFWQDFSCKIPKVNSCVRSKSSTTCLPASGTTTLLPHRRHPFCMYAELVFAEVV